VIKSYSRGLNHPTLLHHFCRLSAGRYELWRQFNWQSNLNRNSVPERH
jgi:hypothetical protein